MLTRIRQLIWRERVAILVVLICTLIGLAVGWYTDDMFRQAAIMGIASLVGILIRRAIG